MNNFFITSSSYEYHVYKYFYKVISFFVTLENNDTANFKGFYNNFITSS